MKEHLMLFELDSNKDELELGQWWIEATKETLENSVKSYLERKDKIEAK